MQPARRIRVGVADDHPHLRRLVETWVEDDERLEWAGEAADGEAALTLVAELRPDVLILDVEMPVLDGLTALERLRQAEDPVIVVLYSSDPSVKTSERAAGADAVYLKGDPIPDILERVVTLAGEAERGDLHADS